MTIHSRFSTIRDRYLKTIAEELEAHISALLSEANIPRVDRIAARAKDVDSFVRKAEKTEKDGSKKYLNPFLEIQDQIGARITVFYQSDVDTVTDLLVSKYFSAIEHDDKIPDTDWEFGYFGRHFILTIPSDVLPEGYEQVADLPQFFELQIKTLFQHAWSEANHDLGYKAKDGDEPKQMRRRLAFASAQAWGADQIFEELFSHFSHKD